MQGPQDGPQHDPSSYYWKLQITKGSATKWAEKVLALIESNEMETTICTEEPIMAPGALTQAAINRLNEKITNEVFLIIENDEELRREYERTVKSMGKRDVNKLIGKGVKATYNLINADGRENNPSSTLISSHLKLKLVES